MTNKRYYLGTGTEFVKAQCKEYKTLEGALKAAAKDESFVVWDEDGNIIGGLTDDVPEGALDSDVPENDAEQGENKENESNDTDGQPQDENAENEANTTPQDDIKEEIGRFNVTVVCEGSLRLRRSATFETDNECGRASKGQRYIGKRIFMSDGLPMLETVDGIFMSAADIHVKIEKIAE